MAIPATYVSTFAPIEDAATQGWWTFEWRNDRGVICRERVAGHSHLEASALATARGRNP